MSILRADFASRLTRVLFRDSTRVLGVGDDTPVTVRDRESIERLVRVECRYSWLALIAGLKQIDSTGRIMHDRLVTGVPVNEPTRSKDHPAR